MHFDFDLGDVRGWVTNPIFYAVTGSGILLMFALVWAAALTPRVRRGKRAASPKEPREKMSLENKLTFLVALIIAGISAQGMGKFFYDKLDFPLELVIGIGGVLELAAFTCALRARRNIRDPKIGKAGVDGIAVWVVTVLSGLFAAMEADELEVRLFRLAMPLLAAWLWERGMAIERRHAGGSTIHWRFTLERVLVWLRIAEPTGRTASEVDAHRRLTRVAKAAARVRALRTSGAAEWRVALAQGRLERATRAAVVHAGLAQDPERQRALLAQLGSLYNADELVNLTPTAPWQEFATPPKRTWFEVQGLPFEPITFGRPPVQVRAEVQESQVHEPVRPQVRELVQGPVCEPERRELEPGSANQSREPEPTPVREPAPEPEPEQVREPQQVREPREPNRRPVREPASAPPRTPKPRTTQKPGSRTPRTANLTDRAAKKNQEVRQVLNLIRERGSAAVTLDVVMSELGLKKTTAFHRLKEARELANQNANHANHANGEPANHTVAEPANLTDEAVNQ